MSPIPSHWRAATCAELECEPWRNGWKTIVSAGSIQEDYIKHHSGRRFEIVRSLDSATVSFYFPPGQVCFGGHEGHVVKLERDPLFIHTPKPGRARVMAPMDWIDTHKETLFQIRHRIQQG